MIASQSDKKSATRGFTPFVRFERLIGQSGSYPKLPLPDRDRQMRFRPRMEFNPRLVGHSDVITDVLGVWADPR